MGLGCIYFNKTKKRKKYIFFSKIVLLRIKLYCWMFALYIWIWFVSFDWSLLRTHGVLNYRIGCKVIYEFPHTQQRVEKCIRSRKWTCKLLYVLNIIRSQLCWRYESIVRRCILLCIVLRMISTRFLIVYAFRVILFLGWSFLYPPGVFFLSYPLFSSPVITALSRHDPNKKSSVVAAVLSFVTESY